MTLSKNFFFNLFVSLRPRQWIKNLIVFSALVFSRQLFIEEKFLLVLYTFFVFCAASSAMYLVNDVVDRASDKQHFKKKFRPIAKGRIDSQTALTVAFILIATSFLASYRLSHYLVVVVAIYFVIQLSYTLLLKKILIVDVLTIAFAFMLRIFAGSVVILAPLSSWLIMTTIMLATFLSIGKRRSELTLLSAQPASKMSFIPYRSVFLDGLVFMMGTATIITYSLFTFNSPEVAEKNLFSSLLPSTLVSPKFLMATIPVVLFGIFRYIYLIFEKTQGDSPEKVLLSDLPLFVSVLIWFSLILFFLYLVPL
jgi:4-hydroxybenzoate polyprenyltransferase